MGGFSPLEFPYPPPPTLLNVGKQKPGKKSGYHRLGQIWWHGFKSLIRGLLVADLYKWLWYGKERTLLAVAFVWGERNETCYSEVLSKLTNDRLPRF